MIYAGAQPGQSADFQARFRAVMLQAFESVEVEYSPDAQQNPGIVGQWPSGCVAPRPEQTTVVIRAYNPFRCGMPQMAALLFSLFTAGLVPYFDNDSFVWLTEVYDGQGHRLGIFPFGIEWGDYSWLPLTPLVPFNMLWRVIRGDEHDAFLRIYPSHLKWQLAWLLMKPPQFEGVDD